VCSSDLDAGECGQERVVGVEESSAESPQELRSGEFEEAGADDEVGVVLGHRVGERGIPCGAVRVVAESDDETRDSGIAGKFQARALSVRPDGHDVDAVSGILARLKQRLEVRTATGNEYDYGCHAHILLVACLRVRPGGGISETLGRVLRSSHEKALRE